MHCTALCCAAATQANAALYDEALHGGAAEPFTRSPTRSGRPSRPYLMRELVDATLEAMVEAGGDGAYAIIKHTVPQYTYFNPSDGGADGGGGNGGVQVTTAVRSSGSWLGGLSRPGPAQAAGAGQRRQQSAWKPT